MLIQCPGCNNYFELEDVKQEETTLTQKEKSYCECLLAHIEKILYGRSVHWENQLEQKTEEIAWADREAA